MNRIRLLVLVFKMFSMHVATKFADSVQLAMIEHLAELLEFVLCFFGRCIALFLVEHALEGVEIRGILHETGDVDLGADEVAQGASRVKERCLHEQVHERGAVTSTVERLACDPDGCAWYLLV